MATQPYQNLRDAMRPEARERAQQRAADMLKQLDAEDRPKVVEALEAALPAAQKPSDADQV